MSEATLDQRFAEAMGQLLGPEFPSEIGLAVSGGGDSMAMLALAHNWARVWGVRLSIVTVDHGLRAESEDEAEMVAAECAALGWPHDTVRWHWDGHGNVQSAARDARLSLINNWRGAIRHVLMAHTQNDVAETFLIRLARGSGVEGLSAMVARRAVLGFEVVRPCLTMTRQELREYARRLQMPWAEDPSNDDISYDRVRARRILAELDGMGLTQDGLVKTAGRMQRARQALNARCQDVAQACIIQTPDGGLSVDLDLFGNVERDTQMRLLAAGLMWIASQSYRPRADQLEALLDRVLAGGSGTLNGVQAGVQGATVILFRETSGIAKNHDDFSSLWDGRWRINGPGGANCTIRPLGAGVAHCPDWRESGVSYAAIQATPSVWDGDTLIAAPIARYNPAWSAQIVTSFTTYLLSH